MDDGPLSIGFFRIARSESKKSNFKIKMGAVIARARPIATGHNSKKTHPKFANPNLQLRSSIHAEISCLINSPISKIYHSDIYVYREFTNGNPALARPCEMCMKVLKQYGVRRIFYTINEYPFWKVEEV